MAKRKQTRQLDALANAAVTGGSTAVVTAAAAIVGAVVAREFGRNEATDGFFAAYGIYVVLVLAATALRVVVLPSLVRGRLAGRFGQELAGYAAALAVVAVPVLAVAIVEPRWLAAPLTATPEAEATAAQALRWLVPAALAQVYAGLAASALAAWDEYVVAAVGFAAGACAGVALILVRLDDGIAVLSYGLALNGAVSLAVPLIVLAGAARGRVGGGLGALRVHARLLEFVRGVGLPLAVQGLLLIGLRSAGQLGIGQQTSFSYAYLIASSVVSVTAASFSLVTAAPLTRLGVTAERAGRHVAHLLWLSLLPIAASAAVLGAFGAPLLHLALGEAFAGAAGRETALLVLYLAPWMAASAAVAIAFPLLFVVGRVRLLPLLAVAAVAVHVPVDAAGRELLGLAGIAFSLALTTAIAGVVLLALATPGTVRAFVGAFVRADLPTAWRYARSLR